MTAPAPSGPAELAGVLRALSIPEDAQPDSDPRVRDAQDVVDAVNSLVVAPVGWLTPPAGDGEWPAHHRYGARLLCARLYRRKDTPAGVLQFGVEGAVYVQRNDPDVAQLLELGAYAKPRVG